MPKSKTGIILKYVTDRGWRTYHRETPGTGVTFFRSKATVVSEDRHNKLILHGEIPQNSVFIECSEDEL